MKKTNIAIIATTLSLTFAATASAGITDFSGMNLNGAATLGTNSLVLTPSGVGKTTGDVAYKAGSAFQATSFGNAAGTFSTQFSFRMVDDNPAIGNGFNDIDGNRGADGITFTIQNAIGGGGINALGSNAQGLGYEGIPKSLSVEFDTWYNNFQPGTDVAGGNHVGINFNGNVVTPASHAAAYTTLMNDGNWHTAWIDYNGDTLSVRVADNTVKPTEALLSVSGINLPSLLGWAPGDNSAFVGFTGATGMSWNMQEVVAWNFTPVPIPGALILLGSGLTGLLTVARKKRAVL